MFCSWTFCCVKLNYTLKVRFALKSGRFFSYICCRWMYVRKNWLTTLLNSDFCRQPLIVWWRLMVSWPLICGRRPASPSLHSRSTPITLLSQWANLLWLKMLKGLKLKYKLSMSLGLMLLCSWLWENNNAVLVFCWRLFSLSVSYKCYSFSVYYGQTSNGLILICYYCSLLSAL